MIEYKHEALDMHLLHPLQQLNMFKTVDMGVVLLIKTTQTEKNQINRVLYVFDSSVSFVRINIFSVHKLPLYNQFWGENEVLSVQNE